MSVEPNKDMNAPRAALESIRKDANDPTLSVGDIVFSGGIFAAVIEIKTYAPGAHSDSPIRNDLTAVKVVTDMGSARWHGLEPEATPQSGYTACACRDCMDTTVSSDTSKPELCTECTEAGCEAVWTMGLVAGSSYEAPEYECQRDDAYGDDSDRSCGCGGVGVHGVDHGDDPDA